MASRRPMAADGPPQCAGVQLTESQPSASFSIAWEALPACRRVLKSRSCTEINLMSTEQKWTSFAADGWKQDPSASNSAAAEATNPGEGMVILAAQGPVQVWGSVTVYLVSMMSGHSSLRSESR